MLFVPQGISRLESGSLPGRVKRGKKAQKHRRPANDQDVRNRDDDGQVIQSIHIFREFDELIADTFYKMVNGVNEKAGVYILRTIGTILENYASYRGRDKAPEAYEQRKKYCLDI